MTKFLLLKERKFNDENYSRIIGVNFNMINFYWFGKDVHTKEDGYHFNISGFKNEEHYYFCELKNMPQYLLDGEQ